MKKNDVLYVGVSVNPHDIKNLLKETPFSEYSVKEEAHMTVCFRPNNSRLAELMPLIGKEVELHVEAVGTLTENSILMNVGLRISADGLEQIILPPNVPHITVWINEEKKAKAVNTRHCQWTHPLSATLQGRLAVYNGKNEWAFSVE